MNDTTEIIIMSIIGCLLVGINIWLYKIVIVGDSFAEKKDDQ